MAAVDICNLALGSLGLEPINQLSDDNQRARTCTLFYDKVRINYLTEHDWSFATSIVELVSETTEIDGYGWAEYKFSYPTDCIKAQRVTDGENGIEYPFVIRNAVIATIDTKLIFANLEKAFLEYTFDAEDTDEYSSPFYMALSEKLAYQISWPLTKDLKIKDQALQNFLIADSQAKQKDSSEQLPISPPPTWEESRSGILDNYLMGYYGRRY